MDLETASSYSQISKDDTQGADSANVVTSSFKEEPEKTSTVSIGNATPRGTKIATQVRTQAGRLVRPVNRLIQNMTQKAAHSSARNFAKSLLL